MNNYYNLNIPFKIVKDSTYQRCIDLTHNISSSHWMATLVESKELLTEEFIEYFYQNKINITHSCIVFKGNPNSQSGIHIDTIDGVNHNKWAINLAWGSNSSEMIWYSLLADTTIKVIRPSTRRPYIGFKPSEVEEIERVSITDPCLVRTDIPHNIINTDPINFRWCLSIRGESIYSSWEDALDMFRPLIVN